jgi:predicted component of type VI protein secretion system
MEKCKILIGRSSQCDYIIEDTEQYGTVSGQHATISETDKLDAFLFEDHSTNGSYVNGQLLHNDSCLIRVGDHITLGRSFVLPLEDIFKRYFPQRRTTKKKPIEQQPDNPKLEDGVTIPAPPSESIPQGSSTVLPSRVLNDSAIAKNEVPKWFWVLYAVSIIIAFLLGCII